MFTINKFSRHKQYLTRLNVRNHSDKTETVRTREMKNLLPSFYISIFLFFLLFLFSLLSTQLIPTSVFFPGSTVSLMNASCNSCSRLVLQIGKDSYTWARWAQKRIKNHSNLIIIVRIMILCWVFYDLKKNNIKMVFNINEVYKKKLFRIYK